MQSYDNSFKSWINLIHNHLLCILVANKYLVQHIIFIIQHVCHYRIKPASQLLYI